MTIIQANKYYFLRGGAERYVFNLTQWLEAQGNTVVPFAMQHPHNRATPYAGFFPRQVLTEQVSFGPSALRTLGRMFYSREAKKKMAALIREVKPELCHVHNIYTQLSPSILSALQAAHVPTVMTVHDHHLISPQYNIWAKGCGPDFRKAGLAKAVLSRFHKGSFAASLAQTAAYKFARFGHFYEKHVQRFLVPSRYLYQAMVAGGFPKEKMEVLPHGIDPDVVEPRYDHDGYMLYVGRISVEKGVETLVRIARLLPDIKFKIVGVGPHEARMHLLSHGHDNIELIGFKVGDELRELYRGAMAVLLPSQVEEVFPLTALEALAAGKPVIGSHVGGMGEVVEDRRTGFLVAPTDLHGFVEATMRLAYDDDLRGQLSRQARLEAETTFNISKHYARIREIYQELK
jgi:glycosyltransferase involved in cell wall biosynthesis